MGLWDFISHGPLKAVHNLTRSVSQKATTLTLVFPCMNRVQEDIDMLPAELTGQIVVKYWQGRVTRLDTKTSRIAPKAGEMKRRRSSTWPELDVSSCHLSD